ncbi:hypothetical protein KAM478_07510 [Aeromonas caviae]|nr:hypothetical protein KAM466_08670 [Aeromonas caviae]GKR51502.1 hypothetical protein KAM475_06490 [Aeromonas caviae]GKR64494.1 hypothetical protein KAM478_07510 [Aeromonas caviae]
MVESDQGIAIAVKHGLELMDKSDVIVIPAWSNPSVVASTALVEALKLANVQGKLIVGLCLVHRGFPGKAALIFRKKYSESLNPYAMRFITLILLFTPSSTLVCIG